MTRKGKGKLGIYNKVAQDGTQISPASKHQALLQQNYTQGNSNTSGNDKHTMASPPQPTTVASRARWQPKRSRANRRPPPSAAVVQVFSIPELCEQILLNLPIRQLVFPIPMISRVFHTTIRDSIKLQRALFFQPIPETVQWPQTAEDSKNNSRVTPHEGYQMTTVQNPLSCVREQKLWSRPQFWVAEASWRRMYLCQPPQSPLAYFIAGKGQSSMVVFEEGGVKLSYNEKGEFIGKGEPMTTKAFEAAGRQRNVCDPIEQVETARDVEVLLRDRGKMLPSPEKKTEEVKKL